LDLNIRVTSQRDYDCDDINIEFSKLDGTPLNKSNIELSKFFELYAQGKRKSLKYPNYCRFYFTGSIKRLLEHRQESLLMKISGEHLKTRYVAMRLKESYTSFVDINLMPKDAE